MNVYSQHRECIEKRLREMQNDPNDRCHGTPTGYKYGCRCFKCRYASYEQNHARYWADPDKYRARSRRYYAEKKARSC